MASLVDVFEGRLFFASVSDVTRKQLAMNCCSVLGVCVENTRFKESVIVDNSPPGPATALILRCDVFENLETSMLQRSLVPA
jgi:hypothetical protein